MSVRVAALRFFLTNRLTSILRVAVFNMDASQAWAHAHDDTEDVLAYQDAWIAMAGLGEENLPEVATPDASVDEIDSQLACEDDFVDAPTPGPMPVPAQSQENERELRMVLYTAVRPPSQDGFDLAGGLDDGESIGQVEHPDDEPEYSVAIETVLRETAMEDRAFTRAQKNSWARAWRRFFSDGQTLLEVGVLGCVLNEEELRRSNRRVAAFFPGKAIRTTQPCDRCRVLIREGVEGVACVIPGTSGRAGGQNCLFCFLLKKPCNASGGVHPPTPPRREASPEPDAWEQAHQQGGLGYLFFRLGEIRNAREEAEAALAEWAALVRTLPEPIRFQHVEDVSAVGTAGWTSIY